MQREQGLSLMCATRNALAGGTQKEISCEGFHFP